MYALGDNSVNSHQLVEDIMLRIGLLYGANNDFRDLYGDSAKVGNDIQEAKCTWFICRALQLADRTQRQTLVDNYGVNDGQCVDRCRRVFDELNMRHEFNEYVQRVLNDIYVRIDKSRAITGVPDLAYESALPHIYIIRHIDD